MKKIIILFFGFLFVSLQAQAINWVAVDTERGRSAYVDSDSIVEFNNYYFYNVKMMSINNELIVVTIQSGVKNPFSARLKVYKIPQYEQLKGDYENITNNMTKMLEPVTYDSLVYACYKKVKQIIAMKSAASLIQF